MTDKLVDNNIIQMTAEEETEFNNFRSSRHFKIRMENLRIKRNALLRDTDYFALSDVSMSEAMTQYRKDLRDITEGLTTVEEVEAVTWPTKPE